MNRGFKDFIITGMLCMSLAFPSLSYAKSEVLKRMPKAEVGMHLRAIIGLPDMLFDGAKESGGNPELESIEFILKDDVYLLRTNVDEGSKERSYDFPIPKQQLEKMSDYLKLQGINDTLAKRLDQTRWVLNEGRLGYAIGIGPLAATSQRYLINPDTTAVADVMVGTDAFSADAGVVKRHPGGEERVLLKGTDGVDIDDEQFIRFSLLYNGITDKRSDIYELGWTEFDGTDETEPYLKSGIVFGGSFTRGLSLYHNQETGGQLHLSLMSDDASLEEMTRTMTAEIERYDSKSPIGNHPVISRSVNWRFNAGYEEDHFNGEMTRFVHLPFTYLSSFGLTMGAGKPWHNYDLHLGVSVRLGESLPTINLSVSDDDQFFDINMTPFRSDRLTDNVNRFYTGE